MFAAFCLARTSRLRPNGWPPSDLVLSLGVLYSPSMAGRLPPARSAVQLFQLTNDADAVASAHRWAPQHRRASLRLALPRADRALTAKHAPRSPPDRSRSVSRRRRATPHHRRICLPMPHPRHAADAAPRRTTAPSPSARADNEHLNDPLASRQFHHHGERAARLGLNGPCRRASARWRSQT